MKINPQAHHYIVILIVIDKTVIVGFIFLNKSVNVASVSLISFRHK